jgi:5'-nucleotidase
MLILVDMDGPLADLEAAVAQAREDTNLPVIEPTDRVGFHVADDYQARYGDEARDWVRNVMATPGFYRHLPVVDGARAGLEQLAQDGHDVRILTSPLMWNPTCASDKLLWADEHFGGDWKARVIIARDKTLVRGDILIDDKPDITGDLNPIWRHVRFDTVYNQNRDGLRLCGWGDIDRLVEDVEGILRLGRRAQGTEGEKRAVRRIGRTNGP